MVLSLHSDGYTIPSVTAVVLIAFPGWHIFMLAGGGGEEEEQERGEP